MVRSSEQVAPHTKEVLHKPMYRQEALRVSNGFEPSHLALALPRRLMRDLGSVVLVLPGAMHDGRHDGAVRRPVAAELVRDQAPWSAALAFQQLPEEPSGRLPIAPGLDEDVDHVTVTVMPRWASRSSASRKLRQKRW